MTMVLVRGGFASRALERSAAGPADGAPPPPERVLRPTGSRDESEPCVAPGARARPQSAVAAVPAEET